MTEPAKNFSFDCGQRGDDAQFGNRACGGDGGATETCEVIAVGGGDALDEAEPSQPLELAGERSLIQILWVGG